MMTLYLNATHGPGGPGFYPESFRVSNGPGACLFLAGARALS